MTCLKYESLFGAAHVTPAGGLIRAEKTKLEFKEHLSFLLILDVAGLEFFHFMAKISA